MTERIDVSWYSGSVRVEGGKSEVGVAAVCSRSELPESASDRR